MTISIAPSVPTYEVYKDVILHKSAWVLRRVDQVAFIGRFPTRKSAVMSGRLLAGFRGQVVIRKGSK
jgi:hypothetical protein